MILMLTLAPLVTMWTTTVAIVTFGDDVDARETEPTLDLKWSRQLTKPQIPHRAAQQLDTRLSQADCVFAEAKKAKHHAGKPTAANLDALQVVHSKIRFASLHAQSRQELE